MLGLLCLISRSFLGLVVNSNSQIDWRKSDKTNPFMLALLLLISRSFFCFYFLDSSEYKVLYKIGAGCFGSISLGIHTPSSLRVAIRQTSLENPTKYVDRRNPFGDWVWCLYSVDVVEEEYPKMPCQNVSLRCADFAHRTCSRRATAPIYRQLICAMVHIVRELEDSIQLWLWLR